MRESSARALWCVQTCSVLYRLTSVDASLLRDYPRYAHKYSQCQSCCERLASADIYRCTAMKSECTIILHSKHLSQCLRTHEYRCEVDLFATGVIFIFCRFISTDVLIMCYNKLYWNVLSITYRKNNFVLCRIWIRLINACLLFVREMWHNNALSLQLSKSTPRVHLKPRVWVFKTYWVCHVWCNFEPGYKCRTTASFGTLKDGNLQINIWFSIKQ